VLIRPIKIEALSAFINDSTGCLWVVPNDEIFELARLENQGEFDVGGSKALQHEDRVRSVSRLSLGWGVLEQVARGLILFALSIFVFKDRPKVRTEKTNMHSHSI
jgi:hypothetical protein